MEITAVRAGLAVTLLPAQASLCLPLTALPMNMTIPILQAIENIHTTNTSDPSRHSFVVDTNSTLEGLSEREWLVSTTQTVSIVGNAGRKLLRSSEVDYIECAPRSFALIPAAIAIA